jgi:hypothetical protein
MSLDTHPLSPPLLAITDRGTLARTVLDRSHLDARPLRSRVEITHTG